MKTGDITQAKSSMFAQETTLNSIYVATLVVGNFSIVSTIYVRTLEYIRIIGHMGVTCVATTINKKANY